MFMRTRRDASSVEIQYTLRISSVQQRNTSANLTQVCTLYKLMLSKETSFIQAKEPKANMLQVGAVYACDKFICSHSEDFSSSDESICLQVKIQCTQAECKKIPRPSHLITNLTYKWKPHQTRNQYLRERLDTCADVNIMPASVYNFVFNDSELKKLAPSTLEIGTYTTDTAKIAGSCLLFYWVHQDTRKLQEVTFYVAQNDGNVLLSCTTTLVLGLIKPHTRLDYLPPRASLITSSVDYPKKPGECLFTAQERKCLL